MPPVTRYAVKRIAATKGPRHRRARLWQAIRILRRFEVNDLLAVCELETRQRESVLTFLSQLRCAGYLRARYGNPGRHEATQFVLIRDSGPQTPALVRRGAAIWDWNTETEYSLKGTPDA